ncbi:MAG TPA: choice-of-anchor Q domain-containing protein [Vicinamibacteria bacterium]|nr:choice-of-anchor Q domain-containing protein [Vicinamibacteria bacterium]
MRLNASVLPWLVSGLAFARPVAGTDVVVGSGPGTCTEAAFASAVATVSSAGGTITFNCGGPATITLTSQKVFQNGANVNLVYTLDGGGNVTLSGGGGTRILLHETGTLNVRNMTLTGGLAQGAQDDASGGALRSEGEDFPGAAPLHLNLTNVTFTGNATNLTAAPPSPFSPFDYGGGALFTRWGTVTMANCTFTSNTAYDTSGGAIHGRSSTIVITGSTFSGNASNGSGFGGAIWVDGVSPAPANLGGTLQISTTRFTGNTSRNQGGAIGFSLHPAQSESVTLDTVSVIGNQVVDSSGTYLGVRSFGGGMIGERGDVTIVNSTFANNVVHSNGGGGTGGGLALVSNGAVTIVNTTISGNRAEGTDVNAIGGGLVISGNTLPFQVTHATIAYNFAAYSGGGVTSQSNGTLLNTIVANNQAAGVAPPNYAQCSAQLTNGGGVLEYPANNPPCVGGARITADPRLGTLSTTVGFSPTHLLLAGSPAIDAGACVIGRDERGVTRPQGAGCDLGAVEVGTPPPPATSYFTLDPCRVLDTRLATGPTGGAALICGVELVFAATGPSCGVPSGAKAISANVTVAQTSGVGSLNAYPAGVYPPQTSIVNYKAGMARANNAVIALSGTGQIGVGCAPTGTLHLVIDVNGYFQ